MGGGPGGRMGMADASDDPRLRRFELMRGYLDAVDRYARLAHDPQMSGIAAVVQAADLLKPRCTKPPASRTRRWSSSSS